MKKRITAILLCLAMVLAVTPAVVAQGENVVYEYALLGETYVPEAGLISGTTPAGETIPADTQQVFLDWAQGSYIFRYPAKTVNVKVYEAAPADTVTVGGTVPAVTSAGLATQFPGCTALSTIGRTDGAPAIEPYAVSAVFWFGGKRVQTIREAANGFAFTPNECGLWLLSYEYTDVFGQVRTRDYPFTVTMDRIIVSALKEQYFVGSSIAASDAYGFYNGKQYPVAMTVEAPDGTAALVEGSYVLSQEGTYTVTATVEMEGETVQRSHRVEVQSGMQSYLKDVEGFNGGVVSANHSNVEALTDNKEGLLLDMTASTAAFTYNGVVDLNKLGKEAPVISFTPNHSYGGSISKVTVTLTDVYDPSNSISVVYTRNSNMTATAFSYDNTGVKATFGSTSVAVNNYYPEITSSIGWSTSFHTFWHSPSHQDPNKTYNVADVRHAMNFAFDTAGNTVYTYGNFYLVEWNGKTTPAGYPTEMACRWFPIADLDAESLPNKFRGFTTGEVYVKLQVENGRGDIMLHSIGGVEIADMAEQYSQDTGILLEDLDGSLPAAVGVPYALPAGTSPYISNLTRTVTLNGQELPIERDSFTPAETGTCTVTYAGINQFGRAVSKTVEIPCIEKPDLTVSYETEAVKLGQVYTVKTPHVQGYGALSYEITLNGELVVPGQKVLTAEEMSIAVTAKDALDTLEQTFQLNVDKDVVTFGIDFPRSALCGSSFTFPAANITDHLTGETLPYEIYADGVKQTEAMTLPDQPGSIQVEYRTARGSKHYTLLVRSGEVLTGADALLLPSGGSAETGDAGTIVTVSGSDPVVRLPYKLSATGLPFQFIVLADQLSFNTMTMAMTDGDGTCVTASIAGLQEDAPCLYVNGQNTLVRVSKQAQTFTSGPYEGKAYYTYTMEYHDLYRAMLNASKLEAAVTTAENGVAFQGFNGGVYLDIYPEDIQGSTATFGITQVGNQYFYSSAFAYGDIVPPALSTTDFFIGNNYVDAGFVLKLGDLKAYDVLQPEAAVEVTVMLADGTLVCQNADPATVADILLEQPGINTVKITTSDAAGSKLEVSYRFTIEDKQGPQLTVSGAVAETAGAGESLTLPGASVTDVSAATVRVAVFDPDGKLRLFGGDAAQVEAVKLEQLQAGIYRIRYIATDEWGNLSTQVFTVTVEDRI